ncbi:cytochrome P450 [Vibrio mimicus]|uniref:cytochrome P450 n=1 Tax=Vibrio mimicus TaxID=674 RepID=UPI0011DC3C63|nr:cytochrome P450 [Vibrio mimicus]TXY44909.1 cytochrome P450 [Vibrio mimicus]
MNIEAQNRLNRIDGIPNYDAKPTYTVLKKATYSKHGLIRILSGHETHHVINYQDVKKILINKACVRGPSNILGGPSILPTLTPKDLLLNLDFPAHTRLKQFVSKDYSRSGLNWLKVYIEEITNICVDTMLTMGTRDLFIDILDKVSVKVNCKLLGIYKNDISYFRSLAKTVQIADKNDVDELVKQFYSLYDYLMDHVRGERNHSDEGLIHKFINDRNKAEPPLNDDEIVSILLGSLLGGDQNTLTVMTKVLYAALYHHDIWEDMVAYPNKRDAYIVELLRLTNLGNASSFPRIATNDIEISSGIISAGSVIYADVYLANRDPNIFPNPLEINPNRVGPSHLQFGYGMHNCMGRELAMMEISTVIDVLANRLPKMQLKQGIANVDWSEGIILRRPDQLPIII